jgi:hypothetical protein
VFHEKPKYIKNKKGRAASHRMVGPDRGGAMWTIHIREREDQPGRWRVINGWPAEEPDKKWYGRS